jgi:hypothetical protein
VAAGVAALKRGVHERGGRVRRKTGTLGYGDLEKSGPGHMGGPATAGRLTTTGNSAAAGWRGKFEGGGGGTSSRGEGA